MTFVENIARVCDSATPAQIRTGVAWYPMAKNITAGMRALYDISIEQAAGILAVHSIQTSWNLNVKYAVECARTGVSPHGLTMAQDKSARILAGEDILTALGGPKITQFYRNILDPSDPDPVTVDRHARDIAFGFPVPKNPGIPVKLRREIADANRIVAATYGMLPCEIQAITWVAWREAKGLSWAD